MMTLKDKDKLSDKGNNSPSGEEFFQLPRAEYLVDEIDKKQVRNIGDLVTNPSFQMDGRFTLKAPDNFMKGAGIRQGDFVVVQKKTAGYSEGCILAVQLGNQQLIRRYFRTGGRIHLQCDPPSKQIIIVEEHTPDFRILGQVLQVIREIK